MDDREILIRLRSGDQGAFDEVFHAHYASLVGMAESMLREREPAEDVVQDVMMELWKRRENIVLESSLRAYLFRAVRNRALNHIRHLRVAPRAEEDAALNIPTAAADQHTLHKEVEIATKAAVAGLPDRCREVFELSRVQGLKYQEIADALGISIKTVEAQMGKAIRVLRKKLAAWLPAPEGMDGDE